MARARSGRRRTTDLEPPLRFRDPSPSQILCEPPEAARPTPFAADRLAHLLPTLPLPLDVAMLELDPRAIGRFRDELHLDFACFRGIGFNLPAWVDIPANHDALRRLVRQHASPMAFAAVNPAVVDMAADARLEHALGDFHGEQVVFSGKPMSDLLGETDERLLDGNLDDNLRTYRRLMGLSGHVISFRGLCSIKRAGGLVRCGCQCFFFFGDVASTSLLNAASARAQNRSKYARSDSIAAGLTAYSR